MAIKHDEWVEIARLYRSKSLSAEELCSVYKCSKKKLLNGIAKISTKPSEDYTPLLSKQTLIDEIIADKYGFGMSTRMIAEKHHLCVETVRKYLRKNTKSPTAKKR